MNHDERRLSQVPMNAIVITRPGGPEVLALQQRPRPTPAEGEVLLHVRAAGVNRPDVAQRQGRYPAPPGTVADVPGLEVAGVAAAVGPGVTRWQPGDRLCALVSGGGYAQYVCVPAGQCLPVPEGFSFAEAAALPETVFTVYHNLLRLGRLQAGERLLVHGGSSGIGTVAIQLARAFGATVAVTVGSDEKGQACLQLGARAFVNYKTTDFETLGRFDVILDMVGGDYFPKNINVLNPDGRLVYINAMQGPKVELNLMALMQKRLTLTGSTLRSRETAFKAELAAAVERNVWPLLAEGKLKPLIDSTFSLKNAAQAHEYMETSRHIGKIVLTVD